MLEWVGAFDAMATTFEDAQIGSWNITGCRVAAGPEGQSYLDRMSFLASTFRHSVTVGGFSEFVATEDVNGEVTVGTAATRAGAPSGQASTSTLPTPTVRSR